MQKLYEQVTDCINQMEADLAPKTPLKAQIKDVLSILKVLLERDGVGDEPPVMIELSPEEYSTRYKEMYQKAFEELLMLLGNYGMTGAEVAKVIGTSPTQVSQMKNGLRSVPEGTFWWLIEKAGYKGLVDQQKMKIHIIDERNNKK
jgi:hypothetical protein